MASQAYAVARQSLTGTMYKTTNISGDSDRRNITLAHQNPLDIQQALVVPLDTRSSPSFKYVIIAQRFRLV